MGWNERSLDFSYSFHSSIDAEKWKKAEIESSMLRLNFVFTPFIHTVFIDVGFRISWIKWNMMVAFAAK